jgi:hypothetical protein
VTSENASISLGFRNNPTAKEFMEEFRVLKKIRLGYASSLSLLNDSS